MEIQWRAVFFYADYGIFDSMRPEWLQGVFDALTGLFDWLVLRMNVGNTVRVVFNPF